MENLEEEVEIFMKKELEINDKIVIKETNKIGVK